MEYVPIYLIFIPIITSMIIYLSDNRYVNYMTFLCQLALYILALKYYMVNDGLIEEKIILLGGWDKSIGIALKNDALSMSFIFLSIFIWLMVLTYCWDKRKNNSKFLFFLMFLQGTFLGLLQTNDLFNLFVFIEIVTIISTILIVYKKDGYSIKSGLYYLLFNSVGMIFYLIGLILIYNFSGTLNMDAISRTIPALRDTNAIKLGYIFIIGAIGVKSAFFPIYNWLPKAHSAAPSSISVLLSSLLVKSGIYAFIRLNNMFKMESFYEFFFFLGFFTSISGIIFALSQKDIKQILAFSTISQIGLILMGLSSMYGNAYIGGIMHIFNHAMFKALLFMGAGTIINTYGIRRITEIRGVFKRLPYTSIFMIVGILSITGVPFLNGFISKEVIKYGLEGFYLKNTMLYIINLGTSIYFIKFSQIFFGQADREKSRNLNNNLSMFLLASICIVLGSYSIPLTEGFFGIELLNIRVMTTYNLISYLIMIGIAYLIFKQVVEKDYNILKKIRHTHISFEATNFLLVMFIFIMMLWSNK